MVIAKTDISEVMQNLLMAGCRETTEDEGVRERKTKGEGKRTFSMISWGGEEVIIGIN